MGSSKDQSNNQSEQHVQPDGHQANANLIIHSIFVKDISYESPASPQTFSLPWEPQVKFDIQVMRRLLEQSEGLYEVVLHATVATKLNIPSSDSEDKSKPQELAAFLIDLKLAGLFSVKGLTPENLDRVLSTTAPTILFPYLSENISALVNRGGFPQFILPPIDFLALYQQRLSQSNDIGVHADKGVTVN